VAAQRTSFEKLQRDRAKKAKAALKRERRQSGEPEPGDEADEQAPEVVDRGGELSATALLELIEHIHKQLDNEEISFEEFEEKKADLMARLPID
jgi:hypothetical protein